MNTMPVFHVKKASDYTIMVHYAGAAAGTGRTNPAASHCSKSLWDTETGSCLGKSRKRYRIVSAHNGKLPPALQRVALFLKDWSRTGFRWAAGAACALRAALAIRHMAAVSTTALLRMFKGEGVLKSSRPRKAASVRYGARSIPQRESSMVPTLRLALPPLYRAVSTSWPPKYRQWWQLLRRVIGRSQAENPLHPLPLLRLGEKIGGGGVPPGLEDFGQYGRVGAAQFPQALQPAP